jgi:hypothetical protein
LRKDPTTPWGSGSSTKAPGEIGSSSGIVGCPFSTFSRGKRIAPSRGPASRARNKDSNEPFGNFQLGRFRTAVEDSPTKVIAAAIAHGRMYGYLTKIGMLSNVSGHFRAGDSTVTEAIKTLILVN